MHRHLLGLLWLVIGGLTAVVVRLTLPRNTVFALGLLAGVAVGGLYTAQRRLSGPTLSTLVVTGSTGIIIATLSVAVLSAIWLPSITTATLGYAIGILATWLLVSGLALDELGGFAAIGGMLLAVGGGAAGILFLDELRLFLGVLFAGLGAGLLVPLSGLVFGLLRVESRGPRRSTDDDTIEPATRFGIEATTVAGLAVAVPFGSRAAALFGYGGLEALPVGVGCGVVLSVGLSTVGSGQSDRFTQLRDRFVERVYRLLDRIENWVDDRGRDGTEQGLEGSSMDGGGGETAAAADADSVATASNFVEGVASRLADHGLVIEAAESVESLAEANSGLRSRVSLLWSRFSGTISQDTLQSGAALQLSAAEDARSSGDTDRAESLADAALELAAPTIGSVAAAVVRGRQDSDSVLDSLAPLFARIEQLLGEERELPVDDEDPEDLQLIQRLLERLIEEEVGEGFDTALSRIRAAAADGWYSVQAGDQALASENYQRALVAYLSAIDAYRRAYDIATDSKKSAADDRRSPDEPEGEESTATQVTASANTYASEASRIETALEALCHDTAAVVIAAVEDLYGDQPEPAVDTEARRTIVRALRKLRQTRTRIDAAVPPVDLADDRYQRAEIARSVARLRRHLSTADESARAGNIEAAVDQYERVADRLDVLSNRAGTTGLTEVARELNSMAAEIGALAREPTVEAITGRSELTVPSAEDLRAPEVAPAGRRLRRTFCAPDFVDLWEFTEAAGDHPLLDVVGAPYPDLVGSVAMSLAGLDPLYTEPDVDSLQQWATEVTLDGLSAAVERLSETHTEIVEAEPAPPPAFREPPAILQDESVTTLPTAEGVDGYSETWLSRATALVEAKEVLDRRHSAVDGFAALEPRVRTALQRDGSLDTTQVSAELLVMAAHHLSGVEYDPDEQRLSKTGEISRRPPETVGDEAQSPSTD